MRLSPENSNRIANMAFACVCLVVLSHIPLASDAELFGRGMRIVRDAFARFPVAFFFLVSGVMLARHTDEKGWWQHAVRKRIRSLLVPYAVWIAVCAALLWMLTGERPIGFNNSGLNPARFPLLVPLWFVRTLFFFVLASPLIHKAAMRGGRWFLGITFFSAVLLSALTMHGYLMESEGLGGLLSYGFSVRGLFYFSFGMWLTRHPISCSRTRGLACALGAMLFLGGCSFAAQRWHLAMAFDFKLFATPFLLMILWYAMPSSPWPKFLVRSSFAIYVAHAVVLGVIWCRPAWKAACPLWLVALFGVVIPIVTYNVLAKALPRVASILFGGR